MSLQTQQNNEQQQLLDLQRMIAKRQELMNLQLTVEGRLKEPALTLFGTELPQSMKLIANYAKGANEGIVKLLGAPVEATNAALKTVGADFLENPGDATEAIRRLANQLGVQTDADNIVGRMGEESVNAILMLAGFMAAAETMAAKQGTSTFAVLSRDFGDFLKRHPGIAVASDLGASAGAVAGHEATESDIGAFGGAIAGGSAATGVSGAARSIARRGAELGKAVRDFLFPRATEPTPIVSALEVPPRYASYFAEEAVAGDLERVENSISAAVNRARLSTRTPEQLEVRVRRELEGSRRAARALERRAWRQVNKKINIPIKDNLVKFTARMEREAQQSSDEIFPMKRIEQIGAMEETVPIRKLISLRADVLNDIRQEAAKDAPRDAAIRNMDRLQEAILKSIKEGTGNDPALDRALALSRELHDKFSRGPVGRIMRKRYRSGESIVPAEQTVTKLLQQYGGIENLTDISRRYRRPRLRTATESAIRQRFREASSEGGPEAGLKFIQKHRGTIKSLAQLSDEFSVISRRLNNLFDQRKRINSSALKKFANADEQVAVERVWSTANPAKVAKELMGKFDEEAQQGLQHGLVNLLFRRTNGSPSRMRALISQPKYSNLFDEVMSSGQKQRLNRIVSAAARIETGEEKAIRKAARTAVTLLARIFGAQVGRGVARRLGGGTVQTPGIISNIARQIAEQVFRATPIDELVARAVLDPRWERVLYSKLPETPKELRAYAVRMRSLISTLEAERQRETRALERRQEEPLFEEPIP